MKKYLLDIHDDEEWEFFKKTYKEKKLGSNLNEAIAAIIKKQNLNYKKWLKK